MPELLFDPFPVLTTGRLVLRQPCLEDADAVFSLRSDEKVMQFIGRPPAKSREDAEQLIGKIMNSLRDREGITWAITVKDEPVLQGTIGFWRIIKEHHRAEIGYLLNPLYQGRGLMQEALETVIAYGFETMKLHSIEAHVNPANEASVRLLLRNGFVREAYFKENFFFDGKFHDTAVYSLIAP
jgi:ribosomal-protein-alanine N-acetyltransferase